MSDAADERSWADVPAGILSAIRERVSWKDYLSFRLTCRDWNSSVELDHAVYKKVKYPFLLDFSKIDSNCYRAYSPACNKTYYLRAPDEFAYTHVSCSRYGWLLVSGCSRIFFYHPSTGDIIHVPFHAPLRRGSFNRMSFSAPPTSPDCVIIGQVDFGYNDKTRIALIRRGQCFWSHYREDVPNIIRLKNYRPKKLITSKNVRKIKVKSKVCIIDLIKSRRRREGYFFWPHYNCAPLFHKEAFYCLAQDGRLGVFNHKAKNRNKMWRVFNTSAADVFLDNLDNEAYLVEHKGDLVAVVVGPMGKFVRIRKFYEPTRVWQIVHDLENHMILLSPAGCVAMKCEGWENTIHFPRFYGSNHVFYSLSTRKFHAFQEEYTSNDLYDTKLPMSHAWMTPTFSFARGKKLDWSRKLKRRRPTTKNVGPKHGMIHPHYFIKNLSFIQPPSQHSTLLLQHKQLARPCLVLRSKEVVLVNLAKGSMVDRSRSMSQLAQRIGSKTVYSSLDHGLLVLVDTNARSCSLFYLSSMIEIPLPTWETSFTCGGVVVDVPPGKSKLVVMIFGSIDDEDEGDEGLHDTGSIDDEDEGDEGLHDTGSIDDEDEGDEGLHDTGSIDDEDEGDEGLHDTGSIDDEDEGDEGLHGKGKDVAMVWRDGDEKWTMHARSREKKDAMEEGLVVHQGRLYGYHNDYNNIAVVELRMGEYVIEDAKFERPPIFSPGHARTEKCLVESCGELFLVVSYSTGSAFARAVIDMKVFKMDFNVMEWRVLENLADRAFFRSDQECYSFCASKSGLQMNSIYFIAANNRDLCVYDYENRTISVILPGPDLDDSWMHAGFIML